MRTYYVIARTFSFLLFAIFNGLLGFETSKTSELTVFLTLSTFALVLCTCAMLVLNYKQSAQKQFSVTPDERKNTPNGLPTN